MKSIKGKTALVTGASSGIGEAVVKQLLEKGCVVFAAARRVEKMRELETLGAHLIKLDITDSEAVRQTVGTITAKYGSVDILINNAGYGSYGAIEDVTIEEARRQFDVNIFGLAQITQLVLPGMRENRYGKIVNVSSMGGKIYTPYGGWYHATKHALEGLSDCLRLETKKFGIDVIIIQPGGINTDWGIIAAENLITSSAGGPYAEDARQSGEGLASRYKSGKLTDPAAIGRVIVKSVTADNPKTRYAAGFMAKPALFLRRWFSDRLFDKIIVSQV